MKRFGMIGLAALFTVAGTSLASAQEAFTTGDVNMRAGPQHPLPVRHHSPRGTAGGDPRLHIQLRLVRRELAARTRLGVQRVPKLWLGQRTMDFYEYRRRIGVPVISFGFGNWDRHCRNRPWFDEGDYWSNDRLRARNRNNDRDRRDWNRDEGDDQARTRARDDVMDSTGSKIRFADECAARLPQGD